MCAIILGFSRVRVRVSIRVSLVYLVCATTLGNNVAPSVRMDGNLQLNFTIAKFRCKFPSIWTENSIYMRINFHPYGWKIANYYT